jgi:hypothetical protein
VVEVSVQLIDEMPPKSSQIPQFKKDLLAGYSLPKTGSWLRRMSFPEDEWIFDPKDEEIHVPASLKYNSGKPSDNRPNPSDTTGHPTENAFGLLSNGVSSPLSGASSSIPQTPTHTLAEISSVRVNTDTSNRLVTPPDGQLPSEKQYSAGVDSECAVPADSFCLGTAVHMAAVALRPKALVATGIPYPLVDTYGVQTQFLSKNLAQTCFAAILELSQEVGLAEVDEGLPIAEDQGQGTVQVPIHHASVKVKAHSTVDQNSSRYGIA